MRRARTVRRAPARAHPARRLGLSNPRPRSDSRPSIAAGGARCRGRSRVAAGVAADRTQEVTTAVLGIADDRALGGSMRVIVTRPQSLVAAKAAVDEVIREIDIAASRFREDSELCRLNAMPDKVIKVRPLLAQAIESGLRGARMTEGAGDLTIGDAV